VKRKHLLLLGGAAAAGYLWYRSRRSIGLSGLGEATADSVQGGIAAAKTKLGQLLADAAKLPAQYQSGYNSSLGSTSANGVGRVIQLAETNAANGNYENAAGYIQDAQTAMARIAPLIAADLAKPGSATEIVQKRLEDIAVAQKANEKDLALAQQGAVPWILGKGGEAIGAGTGQVISGLGAGFTGFLKKIPWWAYVVGVGGVGLYFFWPFLPMIGRGLAGRAARKMSSGGGIPSLAGEPANQGSEYVFSNNSRRRRSRR
jgi:hypothetical protein